MFINRERVLNSLCFRFNFVCFYTDRAHANELSIAALIWPRGGSTVKIEYRFRWLGELTRKVNP